MKIIEEGKPKWSKRFQCKGCNAILEAEQEDIQYKVTDAHTTSQQYQLEIEGDFIVVCPQCGAEAKFKDVPPKIKEALKKQ